MAAAHRVALGTGTGAPRPRRRLLRFLPLVILLSLAVEIVVVWWLVHQFGAGWVLLLAVLGSLLGLWLVRREGPRAWRGLRGALAEGRIPAPEAVHGMIVLTAGVLLLFPGLVTDILAILLLLPPVSALLSRRAARRVRQRVATRFHQAGLTPPVQGWGSEELRVRQSRGPRRGQEVIEGEIIDG